MPACGLLGSGVAETTTGVAEADTGVGVLVGVLPTCPVGVRVGRRVSSGS